MNSTFKRVRGTTRYAVDSKGRVRGPKGWLRPYRKNGYLYVDLCGRGRRCTVQVHVLVAKQFIGRKPQGMDVNHKNGIKVDNCVRNLEYVSRSRNIQHAYDCGLNVGPRKVTPGDVAAALKTMSKSEAAKHFGVHVATIYRNQPQASEV